MMGMGRPDESTTVGSRRGGARYSSLLPRVGLFPSWALGLYLGLVQSWLGKVDHVAHSDFSVLLKKSEMRLGL
jgi:hypothetical protein